VKIGLILLVVIAAIWFFKSSRRGANGTNKPASKQHDATDVKSLEMVRCQFCEIHLPRPDAIEGKKGIYCSLEHKRRAEP
jgi:uncharacterized protein